MPRSAAYAIGLLLLLFGPLGLTGQATAAYTPTRLDRPESVSLVADDSTTTTSAPVPPATPSKDKPRLSDEPAQDGMSSTTSSLTHSSGGAPSGLLPEPVPSAPEFVTRLAMTRERVAEPSHLEELFEPPRC